MNARHTAHIQSFALIAFTALTTRLELLATAAAEFETRTMAGH